MISLGRVCGVVFSDWFTTKRELEVLTHKCICVIHEAVLFLVVWLFDVCYIG